MADYPLPIAFADFTDKPALPGKRRKNKHKTQRSVSSKSRTNSIDEVYYGVTELTIETAAGASTSHVLAKDRKRSRTQPAHAPIASNAAGRVCFVPRDPKLDAPRGGAGETVTIKWKLRRPELIDHAVLELFVRSEAAPIWSRELIWDGGELVPRSDQDPALSKDRAAAGELEWDGCLDQAPPGMKEACVCVGGSPYKLKLTVIGASTSSHAICHPAQAWTYFDVLVHGLALSWEANEAKSLIPKDRDDIETARVEKDDLGKVYRWKSRVLELEKAILDDLHAAAPSADHEVVLASNLFTTELVSEGKSDAGYRAYRTKWGQGPLIPLFARLSLRSSQGAAVDAPWALDGARVLWDWEDRDQFAQKRDDWLDQESDQTKDYVEEALDFLVDYEAERGFAPRSNNCHALRGGKRGEGAKPVFPKVDASAYADDTNAAIVETFPFEVTPCPELVPPLPRRWASVSKPRTRGYLAGRTGVLFQPSRMAGDCYRVTAYLHYDDDQFEFAAPGSDLRRDRPAATRDSTGVFEVWRKIDVKVFRKTAAVTNINTGTVRSIYEAAGVELDISVQTINGPGWEAAFNAALDDRLAALGARGQPMRPPIPAHSVLADQKPGPDAVTFKARAAVNVPANLKSDWDAYYVKSDLTHKSSADIAAINLVPYIQAEYIDRQFPENAGHEGAFVFLYRWQSSELPVQLEGAAHSASSWLDRAAVYVAYDPNTPPINVVPNKYGQGNNQLKAFDYIVAHEIGHALFIKHAAPDQDPNNDVHLPHVPPDHPPGHDTNDACIMNYHPQSQTYCGLCILRLRGWSCYGPDDDANTETLTRLATTHNPTSFMVERLELDIPVSPPRSKRLVEASDTVYNLPARVTKTFTAKTDDLRANPPLVLISGTIVDDRLPADGQRKALAKPMKIRAVVRMPAGAKVVWRLSRARDDHPKVIEASAKELPTIIDHRDGTVTLLADAVGTFHLRASVNVNGGMSYDDSHPEFVCASFVMVGAQRRKAKHEFERKYARVYRARAKEEILIATMNDEQDEAKQRYVMSVRSLVRLVGGGPDGMRGLDEVRGGWINNMTREGTAARYVDRHGKPAWAGEGRMIHIKQDKSIEPLAPPLDANHPMVDAGVQARANALAGWAAHRVVLSSRKPHPNSDFTNDEATKRLSVGCELWFRANDAPEQGWDLEPPTKAGQGMTLSELKLDNDFVAYLCLWTANLSLLVGVLEEVPWVCTVEAERVSANKVRLRGKPIVRTTGAVVHDGPRASFHTKLELYPPTTLPALVARNMPDDTDWETGD